MAIVAQRFHESFFDEIKEIEDFNLRKATTAALETGQLTPIIKEELKLFIQSRRLSIGQDELTVTFSPPNRDENLVVDPEKLSKRREQNRQAAKRFRQKLKTKVSSLVKELEIQQKRNVELKLNVAQLTIARNNMSQVLAKMLKERHRMNN